MVHLTTDNCKQGTEEMLGIDLDALTDEVLARCETIAGYSGELGRITRTFLCEAMRPLHDQLGAWMRSAGMSVRRDHIGNLIGHYPASQTDTPVFLIGSHLDSVPDAGKYDGVLGVLLGVAALQALNGRRLPFAVDVIGFSEEEGVRFRTPYLGSRAVCGCFDPGLLDLTDAAGISLAKAIRDFGLDPTRIGEAAYTCGRVLGYVEAHIEQGPVLEKLDVPVAVVEAIAGQSRLWFSFEGKAGHAGTLPMEQRHDALTGAAEVALEVERRARSIKGLVATVGCIGVKPGAVNVVPGSAALSLDVRHADDSVREEAVAILRRYAEGVAGRRGLLFQVDQEEHHPAVLADPQLTEQLAQAVHMSGYRPVRLVSGAGHDAAVMASLAPMTMLFMRSPGGVSHHPDEAVRGEDVRVALEVMVRFLVAMAS
jgi:allantoate deiminase